ncbi:hypothetical protein SAMN05444162_2988 [Paenibacillaceae bacterium GAS479]|nr:hypothetical protein SAMN05444162_2988 [Paenibacillaceae bacterium GAS479]
MVDSGAFQLRVFKGCTPGKRHPDKTSQKKQTPEPWLPRIPVKRCMNEAATTQSLQLLSAYSHSIVAGGLEVMSYTMRLTLSTSLTMRTLIFSSTSQGIRAQSAVMPSMDVTARMPTV